ncbi:hypothetical protein [Halarchaeum sp. P4]|uniref:hypothetical protein n=1 Tax=Halarchaeum sp. P4 TaxID=3421639 RepID=UPI003EBCDD7D
MKRRAVLRKSAALAALATGSLAGCTGSGSSPPPRRSNVIEDVALQDGALVADLAQDPWVTTRREEVPVNEPETNSTASNSTTSANSTASVDGDSLLASLSPVGGARAAKGRGGGARGATGRGSATGYSDAPRTHHGRAKYHGGAYVGSWYNNHEDDVTRAETVIAAIAVARIGETHEEESSLPDAGPVPWDETWSNPDDTVEITVSEPGWYRVGTHLETPGGTDLGWECVDVLVEDAGDSYTIEQRWKVSPRI